MVNPTTASAVGRMMVPMAIRKDIPLINIVRRAEQAELLSSLGAKHVLVSSETDFDAKLSVLAHKLKATSFWMPSAANLHSD